MIKKILQDLFSFQGRLERSEFLAYTGATVFLAVIALFVAQGMVTSIVFGTGGDATANALGFLLGFTFIVFNYVHAAVVVKRLHDMDISGYWYGFIALALTLSCFSDKEPGATIVTFAAAVAYIGLAMMPGTKNVNYYSN